MLESVVDKRLTDHYQRVKRCVLKYQPIWNREIIDYYPGQLEHYALAWIEELESLNFDQLYQLECQKNFSVINLPELREYFEKLDHLTQARAKIVQKDWLQYFGSHSIFKIKNKKHHELAHLCHFVGEVKKLDTNLKIVDLCGGKGHLSHFLAHKWNIKTTSVDSDQKLQELGQKRDLRYKTKQAPAVRFCHHDLTDQCARIENLFDNQTLSIGLHTCGDLANRHLELFNNSPGHRLLNLGCCYFKIASLKTTNLSSHAQDDLFPWSFEALTLATRSHREVDRNGFDLKNRVKYYRWAFHLLLFHRFDMKDFIPLGPSKPFLYRGSFPDYAREQFKRLKLDPEMKDSELDDFFRGPEIQKIVHGLLVANIIRNQLGRSLEHILLYDRAIHLQENGHHVEILELFDETISPRNIGIYAIHRDTKEKVEDWNVC